MGRETLSWRPKTEAEATSNRAIFIEWLRATGRESDATPGHVAQWRAEPATMAAFAGLRHGAGWPGNLRAGQGIRTALVRLAPPNRRAWSRASLRDSSAAWADAAAGMVEPSWETLVRVVASHLLDAETCPDDVLLWCGDPEDPWPWGALTIGATLVLGPASAAAAEGATCVRRRAPAPDEG